VLIFLNRLLTMFESDIRRLSPQVARNANNRDHSPIAQAELVSLQHAVLSRERTLQVMKLWEHRDHLMPNYHYPKAWLNNLTSL
jgi:hypothetical protein